MSGPQITKQHLIRPTTFREYHESRIGPLDSLPAPVRERALDRERRLNEAMQPGDEIWEWELTGGDGGKDLGLAVVRGGEIVQTFPCFRSDPPKVDAPAGTPTPASFYENGQAAPPGQLQRSSFRAGVRTPLRPEGVLKTMVIDPAAWTADTAKPAFMAPPAGSVVYHGFPLLEQTRMEGWCLGAITDPFEADCDEGCTIGDLFVEAPDGSRAGLVWNVDPQPRFTVVEPPDKSRWGLFHFTFPRPVREMGELVEVFGHIIPVLRQLQARFRPAG